MSTITSGLTSRKHEVLDRSVPWQPWLAGASLSSSSASMPRNSRTDRIRVFGASPGQPADLIDIVAV
jgi:hypothetical protein